MSASPEGTPILAAGSSSEAMSPAFARNPLSRITERFRAGPARLLRGPRPSGFALGQLPDSPPCLPPSQDVEHGRGPQARANRGRQTRSDPKTGNREGPLASWNPPDPRGCAIWCAASRPGSIGACAAARHRGDQRGSCSDAPNAGRRGTPVDISHPGGPSPIRLAGFPLLSVALRGAFPGGSRSKAVSPDGRHGIARAR